jgi:hypothetical protein
MSTDAIVDVVTTYAWPRGWDLAPHGVGRTFAKLARSGQAPLRRDSAHDRTVRPDQVGREPIFPWEPPVFPLSPT